MSTSLIRAVCVSVCKLRHCMDQCRALWVSHCLVTLSLTDNVPLKMTHTHTHTHKHTHTNTHSQERGGETHLYALLCFIGSVLYGSCVSCYIHMTILFSCTFLCVIQVWRIWIAVKWNQKQFNPVLCHVSVYNLYCVKDLSPSCVY